MKIIALAILLMISFHLTPLSGCTIVMVSDPVNKIAGSNEDSNFPLTLVWFVPADQESYARICLGYRMVFNSIQGGLNEKGLFVDGNSVGSQGWKSDPSKEAFMGILLDHILAKCGNIEDVKNFFSVYNVPGLNNARIPVMDKSGESMIVEWYNGQVVFLQNDLPYQVSTNFIESKYLNAEKPCWRYNRAMEMLNGNVDFNLNFVKDILDATHVEGKLSTTVYSFICDLENGDIYIYNFNDFSKHEKYNLQEEIIKGKRERFLFSIFGAVNQAYSEFIENGPLYMVERGSMISRNTGILFFNILKMNYPSVFNMEIDERVLSHVGSVLLGEGKMEDAVYYLERNVSEFPGKPGVFYELGYAYEKSGITGKAIESYKQVILLEPEHKEALAALERLN